MVKLKKKLLSNKLKKQKKKVIVRGPRLRKTKVIPQRTKIRWSVSHQLTHYTRIMETKAILKPRRKLLRWGVYSQEHFFKMPEVDPSKIFGIFYKTTKVNTFLAIIDGNGKVVSLATAGALGITHKPFRISHITAYKLARKVGRDAFKKGLRHIHFFRKVGRSRFYKSNIVQGLRHESLVLGLGIDVFKRDMIKTFGRRIATRELQKSLKAGLLLPDIGEKNKKLLLPSNFFLKKVDQRPHNGTRLPKKKTVKKHYSPSSGLYMRNKKRKKRFSTIFSLMGRLRQNQVTLNKKFWQADQQTISDVWAFFTQLYAQKSYSRVINNSAVTETLMDIEAVRILANYRYYVGSRSLRRRRRVRSLKHYSTRVNKLWEKYEYPSWNKVPLTVFYSNLFGGQTHWPLGSRLIKKPLAHMRASIRLLPNRLQWRVLKRTQFNHERGKQLAREKKQKEAQNRRNNGPKKFTKNNNFKPKHTQGKKPFKGHGKKQNKPFFHKNKKKGPFKPKHFHGAKKKGPNFNGKGGTKKQENVTKKPFKGKRSHQKHNTKNYHQKKK